MKMLSKLNTANYGNFAGVTLILTLFGFVFPPPLVMMEIWCSEKSARAIPVQAEIRASAVETTFHEGQ